jgi:hypothetical protein
VLEEQATGRKPPCQHPARRNRSPGCRSPSLVKNHLQIEAIDAVCSTVRIRIKIYTKIAVILTLKLNYDGNFRS